VLDVVKVKVYGFVGMFVGKCMCDVVMIDFIIVGLVLLFLFIDVWIMCCNIWIWDVGK